MIAYECALLRFVPDAVAGEFANVGLIMIEVNPDGSSGSVKFSITRYPKRISHFFHSTFAHEDWTVWRSDFIYRFERFSRERKKAPLTSTAADLAILLDEVYAPSYGAFKWSLIMAGVGDSLESAFSYEFNRLVDFNVEESAIGSMSDTQFWEQQRDRVTQRLLGKIQTDIIRLETRLPVQGARSRDKFPVVWRNGVLNALDFISFTVRTEETMARKANTVVGKLYGLHKRGVDFKCTLVTSEPPSDAGDGLKQPYFEAVDTLKNAPCIRDVITTDQLDGFLDDAMAEARPLGA